MMAWRPIHTTADNIIKRGLYEYLTCELVVETVIYICTLPAILCSMWVAVVNSFLLLLVEVLFV